MGRPKAVRRLIVNADDFGRSHSINQAVVRAHREGILTTASLMVNGGAADEAIELARQNPQLGVACTSVRFGEPRRCRPAPFPAWSMPMEISAATPWPT